MTRTIRTNRERRKARIRSTVKGTAARPRLSVFKSNRQLTVQAIDDAQGVTLAFATTAAIKKGTPAEKAKEIGAQIAGLLKSKGVDAVVFDRNGYIYTGRVKELADSAREAGLTF
jgi:large subunit ribosomal protein L18